MADSAVSLDKVKGFLYAQYNDEEKWALNVKLLRAVGLFAGSVVLMRNYVFLFVDDLEIPFKDSVFCLVFSFSEEEEDDFIVFLRHFSML
ncbi:hypothetical protein F8388_003683 [Cannabis sativa]|uniref:Uncharacterized protein n=1 Tax=Cannabis sativa TaxID=3483 RepID=A0A7J6GJ32_CANSA|nr:hypothetical protein F8388_003683 [Cannabis sativa]KAF4382924.1 hypothetical protein G4B88_010095 [Cannabis sativa]